MKLNNYIQLTLLFLLGSVTSTKSYGNVTFLNGSRVQIIARNKVFLEHGVVSNIGSYYSIK